MSLNCNHPTCDGPLCRRPKKEPKPVKPIAKMSAKRKVEQRQYSKGVSEAIAADPFCKVKSPVCTGKAQGQNHKQKRSPKNWLLPENRENCCNACNLYIELNKDWAEKNGHFISRFSKLTIHDSVNGKIVTVHEQVGKKDLAG